MPELPEVEIIARGLDSLLKDRVVASVRIMYAGCLSGTALGLEQMLPGSRVLGVRRRAKLVIIDLDEDRHLVFHLKMTGKLLFARHTDPGVDKHTHLSINFADRTRLFFRDLRKFGYCLLLHRTEFATWDFYARLGPEPLQIDFPEFKSLFHKRTGRVKALLLDQERIAGIGNIYADESLHLAGIHPARPCCDIPDSGLRALFDALQTVLNKAIDSGGSSFSDYVNSLGRPGAYQDLFQVYGRRGQPCRCCGNELAGAKVSGRTSVFCPRCQPME
jgi:formamidopyrimidine-DNA glycosylase